MTSVDISGAAATAEQVVTQIAKIEPTVASVVGMFVPGAAPIELAIQPFVPAILSFAVRALHDIANGNGGDIPAAVIELLQHNTKGQPNSPILTAQAA